MTWKILIRPISLTVIIFVILVTDIIRLVIRYLYAQDIPYVKNVYLFPGDSRLHFTAPYKLWHLRAVLENIAH